MNINLTIIGQMISFVVFVWFTMQFVWPPIVNALEARRAKIAEGLAAAERGQHSQKLAEQRAAERLHQAKGEAAEILNMAKKRATEIVEDAKHDAREEGQRILVAARAEIEQEVNRAREELRHKVAQLALAGAERILEREVNADAHKDILASVAQQI